MDSAQTYALSDSDIAVLRGAAQKLSDVVTATPEVFDPTVRDTVRDLNSDIREGPHPQRSTKSALTANRNLLIVVGSAIGSLALSSVILPGVSASVPIVAAKDAVTLFTNNAWVFFLENLSTIRHYAAVAGPDMSWMHSLCNVIDRARARLFPEKSND